MKSIQLKPQTLIQTAVKDAERALKADQQNRVLTDADVAKLPAALKDVVDDFRAAGNAQVKAADVLGALQQSLEAGLKQSLAKGELVQAELSDDLGSLLAFSSVGVQVQKVLAERAAAAPADFSSAAQEAQVALDQADLSVASQVRAVKELARAAQLAKTEAPDQAVLLGGIAKDRATIVRKVVDQTVKTAEQALKQTPGDAAAKQQLATALQAAVDVHAAVNPKSARVKTMRQQLGQLGVAPQRSQAAQPFFARFLENQNRGRPVQVEEPGMMVTMKYPSDNEDGGGEQIGAVTKKFPSDHEEDVGGDAGGGMMVTRKFPSDNEDGGVDGPGDGGGVVTTMKAPSDNEDGGVDAGPGDPGVGAVTEKYPSDAEDGGVDAGPADPGIGGVTEKYPSDAEDGGVDGGGGEFTTLKYPSDNEDGGEGGDVDGGTMVTMKFPSDNEDGGADDGGVFVTLKYPSDNEDGGATPVDPVGGPEPIVDVTADVSPTGEAAQRLAASVLAVAANGTQAIERRIAELVDLGTRARFSEDGFREHNAEIAALQVLLGGSAGVEARLEEIQRTFMVALLTPAGSAALTLEQSVLVNVQASLAADG